MPEAKTKKVTPKAPKVVAANKLSVSVFNLKGEEVGKISLPEKFFGVEVNEALLAQAVRIYQANLRQGTSSTKTRSEVRGGGRKPWKQKGTGRARQGSIRAPQWRGGGIIFGPKPRDYSLDFPDKMKRAALKSALTSRVPDLVVIDEFKFIKSKTKEVATALQKLNASGHKALLVLPEYDEKVTRASRNIPGVRLTQAADLNVLEVLAAKKLLFAKGAVEKLAGVTAK